MPRPDPYERLRIGADQMIAAVLLVDGRLSTEEIAKKVEVSLKTIYRWQEEEPFQQAEKLLNVMFNTDGRAMLDISKRLNSITTARKKYPQIQAEILRQATTGCQECIGPLLAMVKNGEDKAQQRAAMKLLLDFHKEFSTAKKSPGVQQQQIVQIDNTGQKALDTGAAEMERSVKHIEIESRWTKDGEHGPEAE